MVFTPQASDSVLEEDTDRNRPEDIEPTLMSYTDSIMNFSCVGFWSLLLLLQLAWSYHSRLPL